MKLFGKIFLWFIVAIVLSMGVMYFVTRTFQTEPAFSRWQRGARNQLTIYGGTAAQVFNNEGEAGLRQFLSRLSRAETMIEVDLVDANGQIVFGDASNVQDFEPVIARTHISGEPEIDVNTGEAPTGAILVNFADGRRAVLVIRWDPPRAPSLFFDSWLGYIRLAGLLLTGLLLCYLLALYLTSPIIKLREAAQRLAGGDLRSRVAPGVGRRRDEIADLARDFDLMAERIEGLITSQQQLTRDISHELRSPLARMNVALELARQRAGAEAVPALERLETESSRLNEMIGRLLTLSKLESGSERVEPVRISLTELVRAIAADAHFEAEAKGKSVAVTAADACTVMGNENLLRSAIENVLRNAVRYTAVGTAVDVSLTSRDGVVTLAVRDHGGGVPEDEIENLFRPFYRVGEARERKTGGIGLGLAIADRAIKAHGGTIAARNTSNGLEIHITLAAAGAR